MVCIYCGGKTQVINSRAQKRLNHTWRRRECYQCDAIFTTEEAPELSTSLSVRHHNGSLAAYSRDELFASLLKALGHRQTAVDDASALTATITAKLLASSQNATVSPTDIIQIALTTLQHFDSPAAVQYQAYHRG